MEEELIPVAKEFLEKAKAAGVKVVLPRDFVVAPDLKEESQKLAVHVSPVSEPQTSGCGRAQQPPVIT